MKYGKSLVYLLLITGLMVTASPVSAQSDDPICIAAYPCLENGEIDPRFDVAGACGNKWRSQCSEVKSGLVSESLNSCQQENSSLVNEAKELKKKLRKAKLQLRAQAGK